jgi:hypothetical protein
MLVDASSAIYTPGPIEGKSRRTDKERNERRRWRNYRMLLLLFATTFHWHSLNHDEESNANSQLQN